MIVMNNELTLFYLPSTCVARGASTANGASKSTAEKTHMEIFSFSSL